MWKYKRGHKPKGSKPLPRSKALAKREPEPEIDAPEENEVATVNCDITVAQLDTIYSPLQPRQKAIAVLTGLTEEAE